MHLWIAAASFGLSHPLLLAAALETSAELDVRPAPEERVVTCTRKSAGGTIMALGNPAGNWPLVPKAEAVRLIQTGTTAFVVGVDAQRVNVRVVAQGHTKHVTTVADGRPVNNLAYLPDC